MKPECELVPVWSSLSKKKKKKFQTNVFMTVLNIDQSAAQQHQENKDGETRRHAGKKNPKM